MRKFLITVAILALSTVSIQAQSGVSDICKMKRSQYEYDQCIEFGARGSMLRVKGNIQRLLDSPRVPDSEKQSLLKSYKNWTSKVESKCSNNECYWEMGSRRNSELEQIMAKYRIDPM